LSAAVLSPQSRRDLLEAVRWIASDDPVAAQALRDAVAKASRRIGEPPEIGVARPVLADLPIRFLILTGFPHVIVYDSGRRPALILRVLHGARDLPEVLRNF